MTYNNLPPQAYTKDDVAKAYVWIQSQPDYVRNMATSKEALVALYLQSRRNGNLSLEKTAPVSSKDFQSQLKNLASELSQFEDTKKTEAKASIPVVSKTFSPTSTPMVSPNSSSKIETPATPSMAVSKTPAPEAPHEPLPQSQLQKTFDEFKSRPQNFENPLPSHASKKTFQFQIDPRSEQITRSMKAQD